ncbi:mechanosensitive ion channel family protein [Pelobacter propionicus]|uniref:MscS Mechanosensitive ion channel n=1 Tax=Pelobacter propionicus (strain DSM 2379 / NBRC 103807 / OttBd1) TaxID=338966 RepID=A1AU19_PELPD|nr:mechanosensitive ion channel family protein [Pelobacter propionicus]ABL00840.1 MscS Mechanosensitive ion channel [Pelobacter propionicus DSM 2379]
MRELYSTAESILRQTFLGISLSRFAGAFLVLFLSFILKKILNHLFFKVVFPLAEKTRSRYDDLFFQAIRQPAEWLLVIIGFIVAIHVLRLPSQPMDLKGGAISLFKVLVTFDLAWALYNLVGLVETFLEGWVRKTESTLDDHLLPFVRKSIRAFVVFLAFIMTIQNLGYSISGLLASFGIGGLAVALAAKDTLSNIFGSLMILLDRPFHVGDWIKAGDLEGIVEEVGFRSTKIRTFEKTQITVPNNVIANLAVDNISRRPNRRINITVGVTYETKPKQMRQAVNQIRTMLREHPAIDQDFFLVNFTDFGASSLDIMVYCFTRSVVWGEYLETRQDVSLRIMEILDGLGLEIAFPSRSIYIRGGEDRFEPETGQLPREAETN